MRENSRRSRSSNSRICAPTETSRAETGSSAITSSGSENQSAGDADALALAARKLVRIACQRVFADSDFFEHLNHPPATVAGGKARLVNRQRLGDDGGRSHARVERGDWILENHLNAATQRAEPQTASAQPILAPKFDGARVRLDKAQEHARQRGLAASGFADDAERFAARERECHAIHGEAALGNILRHIDSRIERADRKPKRFSQAANIQNLVRHVLSISGQGCTVLGDL